MSQLDDHSGSTLPLSGATSAGDRFRILRPWREGGLGKVSVAEDEQLHREVALKEIKFDHARDKRSCERFVLEAEITGSLEHPGIVPVYALGKYHDGRPFYAMRFVRGDTFEEAIQQFHAAHSSRKADRSRRSVQFRKLLGRFIDVCNAVDYAHSRGVLHRDLKPANIILGKYGETLVVDWGLAKVLGAGDDDATADELPIARQQRDSELTRMGTLVGSPAFMSPEQANGRLDLLGAVSDVYSLGATLCVLLTGRPPFVESDLAVLMRKVQRGDLRPPRQIDKQIPPALEAICLKAMALKPEDRYRSPRQMADDIEHWLADQRVAVHREKWLERVQRWARHHHALVTGVVALLCTALVALSVCTALLGHAELETDHQRQQAVEAQRAADENRRLAEQRAKQSADRFELALEILQGLVFDLQDHLEQVPGTESLREQLLTSAQQRLQWLIDDLPQGAAAGVDSTIIWAHLRLGQIYLLAGKTTEATEQYQLGFQAAQRAADNAPGDVDAQLDLAAAYFRLGELIQRLGNMNEARSFHEHVAAICERIVATNPNNGDAKELLPIALDHLIQLSQSLGDVSAADGYRQKRARFSAAPAANH